MSTISSILENIHQKYFFQYSNIHQKYFFPIFLYSPEIFFPIFQDFLEFFSKHAYKNVNFRRDLRLRIQFFPIFSRCAPPPPKILDPPLLKITKFGRKSLSLKVSPENPIISFDQTEEIEGTKYF